LRSDVGSFVLMMTDAIKVQRIIETMMKFLWSGRASATAESHACNSGNIDVVGERIRKMPNNKKQLKAKMKKAEK
jgi:hypothetical protein